MAHGKNSKGGAGEDGEDHNVQVSRVVRIARAESLSLSETQDGESLSKVRAKPKKNMRPTKHQA